MNTNYDTLTETHFGVISNHSLNQDAIQDIYDQGENLTHASAIGEVKASLRSALDEYFSDYKRDNGTSQLDDQVEAAFSAIEDDWNDGYEAEDERYLFDDGKYRISNSPSLCCLFVEKSPYFTYTRVCSPCAPNAGDLDATESGSLKTYCLGPEWFDDDSAPYPVFQLSDGNLVPPKGIFGIAKDI